MSAGPTKFHGVNYESHVEAQFALWLSLGNWAFSYRPKELLHGGYTPSFVVRTEVSIDCFEVTSSIVSETELGKFFSWASHTFFSGGSNLSHLNDVGMSFAIVEGSFCTPTQLTQRRTDYVTGNFCKREPFTLNERGVSVQQLAEFISNYQFKPE